jgi:hypothetical protein
MLLAILHFIADKDDPRGMVARLMAAVPPGSYLVMSHALSEDLTGNQLEGLNAVYAKTKSGGVNQRSLPDIARFFEGLELVEPGLVEITSWRPELAAEPPRALFYGGVGRKLG